MYEPSIQDLREAQERIAPHIHRTPVMTCASIDAICGAKIHFKCENLQKIGAFKIRGASNAVLCLADEQAARGVATHSSGNHGQALALAAQRRGISAHVVMPVNTSQAKQDAVAGYGARVTLCEATLEAREQTLERILAETAATLVHPYDDPMVICGQGTAALELLEQTQGLEIVVAPIGGGGLISGTCIAVSGHCPAITVIGAEPEQADDAWQSLQAGKIIPVENPDTIADGLRTSLGELTFPILAKHVREIVTVSEAAIIAAMRLIWERMNLIVEPSAAVPLAAIQSRPDLFAGCRVGVILTGGNADLDHLPWA